MEQAFINDKVYEKINFSENPLAKGEYDNCTFKDGDLSNTDLSDIIFIDCTFNNCNLTLAKLVKTVLRDIQFTNCKMLGLQFYDCGKFGLAVNFDNCQLNHSSFFQTKMNKTNFKNCQLQEIDFTQCDLTNAVFENCDLRLAAFDHTLLEKADFRTSFNYSIDPEINKIKKAKFSLSSVAGLLDKYDIVIDSKG